MSENFGSLPYIFTTLISVKAKDFSRQDRNVKFHYCQTLNSSDTKLQCIGNTGFFLQKNQDSFTSTRVSMNMEQSIDLNPTTKQSELAVGWSKSKASTGSKSWNQFLVVCMNVASLNMPHMHMYIQTSLKCIADQFS